MLLKTFFSAMKQTALEIAQQLPLADHEKRLRLEKQIRELRQLSDAILEEWLELEEIFDEKIRPHFSGSLFPSVLAKWEDKPCREEGTEAAGGLPSPWLKGQGYFDLGLYGEAYPLLKEAVEQRPDQDTARLYLAYACIFLGKREEAIHHLSLLDKTSSNPVIRAICNNGMGILLFEEDRLEGAERHFRKALELDPDLFVARYNLGLVLYLSQAYQQAAEEWEKYLAQTQDWNGELSFYLARCYLQLGYCQKAMDIWQFKAQPENEPLILLQLGHFFEDLKLYGDAVYIYRELLGLKPGLPEALHGLGWNLWLSDPQNREAVPLLKKALSLSPQNASIAFSLAWIYFHRQQLEEAENVIQWLLRQEEDFPLALSLSVLLALQRNDEQKAERLAERLRQHRDERPRALGELLAGRIRLSEQKVEEAIRSFQQSVWNNPHLKESYLLQGLAHYLNGEAEKAVRIWNRFPPGGFAERGQGSSPSDHAVP